MECRIVIVGILVLMCLSTINPAQAFFDKLGQGSGSLGGCGGASIDANEPELPTVPPSTTIVAFAGDSFVGKSFVAKRLQSLLESHASWNITSGIYSLDSYPLVTLAKEQKLDLNRLLTDLDYRDEHYSTIVDHSSRFRATYPNWQRDALDWFLHVLQSNKAVASHSRSVFIIDDLQHSFQLEYLQKIIDQQQEQQQQQQQQQQHNQVDGNLKLLTVFVDASKTARKRRGLRPLLANDEAKTDTITAAWSFRLANENDGADQVAEIDKFLAERLLRAIVE